MQNNDQAKFTNQSIRERRTTKALADQKWPSRANDIETLNTILAAAGEAPFHKPADRAHRKGQLGGIQPWRCYHLNSEQCRKLRQDLLDSGDSTKIPKMLAVADFLIQVTWLPNPTDQSQSFPFEPSIQNMEHIAAASAAIQNMLLAATAISIPNYWSSGGALRSPEVFEKLGIPATEILLGAIFLFPEDLSEAQVSHGGLRASRGPISSWSRPIAL